MEVFTKFAVIAALSSISAFALQVHPIPVEIGFGQKVKELSIADDDGKYQVVVKKWTQNSQGEEVLEETTDVVAYPNIFQAPKKIKIYSKTERGVDEKSYRILIRELNINDKNQSVESENTTKVLKTLSIPIFLSPKGKSISSLKIGCTAGGVTLENDGNTHMKILSIGNRQMAEYVLPNFKREVHQVERHGKVETNNGSFEYECK